MGIGVRCSPFGSQGFSGAGVRYGLGLPQGAGPPLHTPPCVPHAGLRAHPQSLGLRAHPQDVQGRAVREWLQASCRQGAYQRRSVKCETRAEAGSVRKGDLHHRLHCGVPLCLQPSLRACLGDTAPKLGCRHAWRRGQGHTLLCQPWGARLHCQPWGDRLRLQGHAAVSLPSLYCLHWLHGLH